MAGFPNEHADRFARENYPGKNWGETLTATSQDGRFVDLSASEHERMKQAMHVILPQDSEGGGQKGQKGSTSAPAVKGEKVRKGHGLASSILSSRSGLSSVSSGTDTLG